MSSEQLPIRDTTQEREPGGKVLFTIHGYVHESLNLQGIAEVLDTFGEHLEMYEGKKVLYLEEAGLLPERARMYQGVFNKQGFRGFLLGSLLFNKLGRVPKNNEIKDLSYRIERHANNDVKRILDLGLLPIDQIRSYFLYMGLDQLRAKHDFDVALEVHSPHILKRDEDLNRKYSELTSKAARDWDKGDFDNCLLDSKNAYSLIFQDTVLREQDMIEEQGTIIKSLLQEEKGGSLFALVGEAHLPIIETIRGNLGDQPPVRYQRNIGVHENLQRGKLDRGLRSGELASDEIYMQSFIVRLVIPQLIEDSIRQGTISTLANNYESALYTMYTVASGISLEKGRELCEQQVPLFEFFLKQWDTLGTDI